MSKRPKILDANGVPFETSSEGTAQKKSAEKAVLGAFSSYAASLYGLDSSAFLRALKPFETHAWVYAAAMAIGLNFSQAPYMIYSETDETVNKRRDLSIKKMGRWGGCPAGKSRMAVKRYHTVRERRSGIRVRGIEPIIDHPLMRTFYRPNDFMTESQMWQATVMWMVLKGSCAWVLLNEDDKPVKLGEWPDTILPIDPERLDPVMADNKVAFWRFRVPRGVGHQYEGRLEILDPDEVILFKWFNPNSYLTGYSMIASAASGIHQDTLAAENTKGMLMNGSDPGGVLMTDVSMEKDEQDEALKRWEQRHKGSYKRGRTALLTAGMKYVQTGLSPQDMQWKDMRSWNREEVLACIGVPKSVMCVTDDLNFAIQISQDRNFWDKRLIPMMRGIEDTLDTTLFYNEPDNVMGMFDLTGIEALKAGLQEQVQTMNILTGPNIHMPPKVAAEVIGMYLPDYTGSDVGLINPSLRQVQDIMKDSPVAGSDRNGQNIQPIDPKQPTDEKRPPTDQEGNGEPLPDNTKIRPEVEEAFRKLLTKSAQEEYWLKITSELQLPIETMFKKDWRSFITLAKSKHLSMLNSKALKSEGPDQYLLKIENLRELLNNSFESDMKNALQKIYEYTITEIGGVPTFQVTDPKVQRVLAQRTEKLLDTVPETLLENTRKTVLEGMQKGETVQQLRERVASVYDVAASSGKALSVARTESAGLANEARHAMFTLHGYVKFAWVTAGDEHVRESHQQFGSSGVHPEGFNYLELNGKAGSLKFPGDHEAPADEVIACRCVIVPVE